MHFVTRNVATMYGASLPVCNQERTTDLLKNIQSVHTSWEPTVLMNFKIQNFLGNEKFRKTALCFYSSGTLLF